MKCILIKCINIYQKILGKFHNNCRFYPTCSEYMKIAINEHGYKKGLLLGIKRLLKCRPFGKTGYDPVPKKNGGTYEKV